ncbi:hypothetical protein F6455_03675 [Proteobacteria bacterium 005FR1]|nr:hypothetical protein [Proteobacteria bacterium 005FR1]
MKFPLLANAFGHQKMILEIGGNAVGVTEAKFQPQQHRRRAGVDSTPVDFQAEARKRQERQQQLSARI